MPAKFDLENERAIIVSSLRDDKSRRTAIGVVDPDDFIGDRFRTIFKSIVLCEQKGLTIDPDVIAVNSNGDDFGGQSFIKKLMSMSSASNIIFHLTQLRCDASRHRAKLTILPELNKMLADKTIDHEECLRKGNELVAALRVVDGSKVDMAGQWKNNLDLRCAGQISFQSVGYSVIDKSLIDGYARGQVSLIAARTRNGKTSYVVDTTRRLLDHDEKPKICVIPMEIGPIRFIDKLVSCSTMTPTIHLRKESDKLTLEQRQILKNSVDDYVGKSGRLTVMANPFLKLSEWNNRNAMNKLESILAEGEYAVVFIDLFQRCLTDIRPMALELALFYVQHLAGAYDTHLCLVHQINRKTEERKDKRPALIDLKGSGGYEEVPDLIKLLHRPMAYKQFRTKDEIEVMIGKQRDYEAGMTFKGEFYPEISRIENVRLAAEDGDDEDVEEEESKI